MGIAALITSFIESVMHVNKVALLSLLFISPCVLADMQEHQPIKDIARQVAQMKLDDHIIGDTEYELRIGHLDSRLRLTACTDALQAHVEHHNTNYSHLTVRVECPSPKPWALRVPVKARLYESVASAKGALQKGDIISYDDIVFVRRETTHLRNNYIKDIDSIVGMETRRRINIGQIIKPTLIQEPLLVKRGEHVKILAKLNHILVQANGIAMTNGKKDQSIRVKNPRSNRIIEARVVQAGVVEAN